ncbi:MAG TPA: ATP-binding protein [Streptosporangiaceae bacterium]|nr:ATP-binding protein [Streptosporangiaceae bacterium]
MTASTGSDATRLPLLDLKFGAADHSRLRLCVEACAIRAGLGEPHLAEFLLAVHEVVDNAIQHGGGRGHLRLRRRNGALHCQVIDTGPGFGDQVAIPPGQPDVDAERGRGLWLVHQLTDRVTITTGSKGSIVSLTVALRDTDGADGARCG